MKNCVWSALLIIFSQGLFVQAYAQVTIRAVDAESFPQYRLDVHVRQPDRLDTTSWIFKQGTQVIDARLDTLYRPDPPQGSDYLFLIENAPFAEWDAQIRFFKQLIRDGLPSGLQAGDRVFVAHFDWKTGADPTLIWVDDTGLNEASAIIGVINDLRRPGPTGRRHRTTEVFPAIAEGLQSLNEKRRDGHPAAIILFSREVQNIYNASPSDSDLASQSKNLDIPIYSVGYPPTDAFKRYVDKVIKLTENTFGQRLAIAESTAPEDYASAFTDLLLEVPIRASGWNYRWVLHTAAKPGQGTLPVVIEAGSERTAVALPVPSYFDWVWSHPGRRRNSFILLGLVFLVLGVTFYFLRRASIKRKAMEEASRKAEVDEIKSQSEKLEDQLKGERERQEAEKAEAEKIRAQAQHEQFIAARKAAFMRLRNRPILIGLNGANQAIQASEVILGRDASAQILLRDDSVSKRHAVITFGGGYQSNAGPLDQSFYISDLKSTNGTIVNGHIVEPGQAHRLADNDLIILGNISLIFRI